MIEFANQLNDIAREYQPLAYMAFGIIGAIWAAIRINGAFKKRASEVDSQIQEILTRLEALDKPKEGRVSKLSTLVEKEIEWCRQSYGMAQRVNGRLDQIEKN